MLSKYKNSWTLSVKNKEATKYHHHYFCSCTKEFKLQTEINEPESPDTLCPMCGNDYFKDAEYWKIVLHYEVPVYNDTTDEIEFKNKSLLNIILRKDGCLPVKTTCNSTMVYKYSLFLDDRVQTFKNLLLNDAKSSLYTFIISKNSGYANLLDKRDIYKLSLDNKIKCLREIQMLDFTLNLRKERSIKKALYQGYENSINTIGCYPYSDYIFSRSVENIDLLTKLYGIYPAIKQHIFTDETFSVAIEFIFFLKKHYTEKQIVKLFIEDIQDVKEYKNRLISWRDTLRMLQTPNAFNSLEEHFSKVKLTVQKLHDELVRVFHLVSYELDAKENFEYEEKYLSACNTTHEELEFKLPSTVKELSLWAKILHNCMFGYSKRIHQRQSIIYGVFKAEELLYAVELSNLKIMQTKGVSNSVVPDEDIQIIKNWLSCTLVGR